MKNILLIIVPALIFVGCVTRDPSTGIYAPDTNAPAKAAQIVDAASTVAKVIPAAAPVAGILDLFPVRDIIASLITGVSVWYANRKNNEAKKHATAAYAIASALPDDKAKHAAIIYGASLGVGSTVSGHVDDANSPV